MPKVPEYRSTETLRPAFRQGIDVQASPEAFGAGIGRGMQGLAQGVSKVGDAVQAVQALDAENKAKDADNQFAAWSRSAMYGENGYLTRQGSNAVEGRDAFDKEVEAKRLEFGNSLTGQAARMYDTASKARTQAIGGQTIVHQAQQRKEWFKETSTARITAFGEDALAGYKSPALVSKNIALGLAELDNRRAMEGWSEEEYARQSKAFTSGTHLAVANRIANDDPIAADKYLTDNSAVINPSDAEKFKDGIERPLRLARADQWLQGAIGSGPAPNFTVDQNSKIIDKMLPITVKTESAGNPNAVSPKGATGLMQVMPGTGRDPGFGIRPSNGSQADTVRVGQEYLGKMMERYNNDPAKAWAAYNAGPGALDKAMRDGGAAWLTLMPKETRDYVAKNMKALGGDTSAPGAKSNGDVGAVLSNLYTQAETIKNVEDREAAYAAIDRWRGRNERVLSETRQQTIDNLEKRIIADPTFDPSKLPVSVQQVIGLSGMNALQNAHDQKVNATKITTDVVTLDALQTEAMLDPEGFSRKDLLPYRDRLSDSDYMALRGKQKSAIGDLQKSIREGTVYKDAYQIANEFYGAAGIVTGNSVAAKNDANVKAKAEFNATLREEVDEFISREKRRPTYDETRLMASALTMRVIGSETRSEWSPARLFDDGQDDVYEGRIYQRQGAPGGVNKRVAPSYADVPAEWVGPIKTTLTKRLGRVPSNNEIAAEYGNVALNAIGGN